jgi:hypothetical protein
VATTLAVYGRACTICFETRRTCSSGGGLADAALSFLLPRDPWQFAKQVITVVSTVKIDDFPAFTHDFPAFTHLARIEHFEQEWSDRKIHVCRVRNMDQEAAEKKAHRVGSSCGAEFECAKYCLGIGVDKQTQLSVAWISSEHLPDR